MEITTTSTGETQKLAIQLAKKLKPKQVIQLYGDLGAGKTTFTSFLVKALDSDSRVQSPTFVISRKYLVNDYATKTQGLKRIYHLDLYRINSDGEVRDLDLNYYLADENAITLIEWPELAAKYLPENSVIIRFDYVDESTRKIYVENSN